MRSAELPVGNSAPVIEPSIPVKKRGTGAAVQGWGGRHQTQQEGALQGREVPSANGGEWASKKCGRDAVEGGAEAEKERIMD